MKRRYLEAFIREVIGEPVVLLGASLGGAVAIDFAVNKPELVKGLVLVDAQGYIDGVPQMPEWMSRLGLKVLRSWPLRSYANQISYSSPETYATEDAVRVGKLHLDMRHWEDASVSFMRSGGYSIVDIIPKVQCETLILWGKDDNILEPAYAEKFLADIGNSTLKMVDRCGHVPHLEQPIFVGEALKAFQEEKLR